MKADDLNKMFDYKPPTTDQINRLARMRQAAKIFGACVLVNCPHSSEQTLAIRKLEESLHYAVAGVMREPQVSDAGLNERFGLYKELSSRLSAKERLAVAAIFGLNDLIQEPETNGEKRRSTK